MIKCKHNIFYKNDFYFDSNLFFHKKNPAYNQQSRAIVDMFCEKSINLYIKIQ